MAGQEAEALGVLGQEHLSEVAVAETNLAVVSYGAGDAESLQAFADGCGCVSSGAAVFLDGDGSAYCVSPLGILEADGLNAFGDGIGIEAGRLADIAALFDGVDTIGFEDGCDLVDTSLVGFKK